MPTDYRVFTNDRIVQSSTWHQSTSLLPFVAEGSGPARILNSLRNALTTLKLASKKDIVVLTDTHNLSASIYGLLINARRRSARPTVIRTDPCITYPKSRIKRAYLRATLREVDRLIVWSPALADRYARALGLPREKMIVQRFHHTLHGYDLTTQQRGNYIFSGGDSMRDYETLLKAVRGLRTPVVIATRVSFPDSVEVPENVTIKAVSPAEFRELLAGAYLTVFPLYTNNLRTSGQQSYLNAMALGKAVIVTDTLDAPYYIENHKTGVLVPSGDDVALGEAIVAMSDRPNTIQAMGEAAKAVALPLDQEYTWSSILETAIQAHEERVTGVVSG